ncbi:MAG: 50S ribosomal protein L15 [Proteobacteria bacterium]|nr:50S ribosomal protein L15 [Pseudomonadota bacterium]
MMLNQLMHNQGAKRKSKRLGRGIGSGKGKTCGRGGKGQTARSGVAIRGFEGGQMPLYIRLPIRGFNSLNRKEYTVIGLNRLAYFIEEKKLDAGKLTLEALRAAGLLKGKNTKIKLVAGSKFKHKISIQAHAASASAVEAVKAAGGSVEIIQ